MNKNNMKTVGILGGMGPYATLMFYKNILDLTPVKKDWDHIRVIIDNNPHIPSCSRAILYGEESPVEGMIESCKRLASYPVDFIVLPWNSACYFLPEVQRQVKTLVLNIIDTTSEKIHIAYPRLKKACVFGGMVTYLKETYRESLQKRGIKYIQHTDKIQNTIVDLIERVKSGEEGAALEELFMSVVKEIESSGSQGIILACTELTLFKDLEVGLPMIDSIHTLAEYTVQIALGEKPIPLDTEEIHNFWKQRAHLLVEGKVSDYQSTLFTVDRRTADDRHLFEKKKLIEVVSKYNGNSKGVAIEYGCGIGRITEVLSEHFESIDGIDYCEEFIQIAKRNAVDRGVDNINYYVSSVEDFVPRRKYNWAICAGILMYLDDDQFSAAVKKIADHLSDGGRCIVREPVGVVHRFQLHNFFSSVLSTVYNAVYRSSNEIVSGFSKYGFTLIHEEISLAPAPDKPETCQKIFVLEKQQ